MQLDLFYDTMGEKRFEILEQCMTPSNILSYPRQLYFYTVKLRVSRLLNSLVDIVAQANDETNGALVDVCC